VTILFTLISSFAIVLSFIRISTDNWYSLHDGFLHCFCLLVESYETIRSINFQWHPKATPLKNSYSGTFPVMNTTSKIQINQYSFGLAQFHVKISCLSPSQVKSCLGCKYTAIKHISINKAQNKQHRLGERRPKQSLNQPQPTFDDCQIQQHR